MKKKAMISAIAIATALTFVSTPASANSMPNDTMGVPASSAYSWSRMAVAPNKAASIKNIYQKVTNWFHR